MKTKSIRLCCAVHWSAGNLIDAQVFFNCPPNGHHCRQEVLEGWESMNAWWSCHCASHVGESH